MATRAPELDAQPRVLVLLAPSALRYRDLEAGYQRRNAILAGKSAAEAEDAARFELEVFEPAVRPFVPTRLARVETLMRERAA